MSINYVKGDATNPIGDDTKIIVHICNDIGGWGKGFVVAISKRWKEPEKEYRKWFKEKECQETHKNFGLGNVQFVQVSEKLWVANMIAQKGIRKKQNTGEPPIRYEAVKEGLQKVKQFAIEKKASIHMPRIGCGLAGGEWEKIESIIQEELVDNNIIVVIYDFD